MNPTLAASTLPELLAQWQQAPLRPPASDVVARLAGWLGWTDAIALSGAVAGTGVRTGAAWAPGGPGARRGGAEPAPTVDPRRRREAIALRAELDDRLAWLHASLAEGLARDETWEADPLPARQGSRTAAMAGAARATPQAAAQARAGEALSRAAAEFAPLRRHLIGEQRRLEQFVTEWRARLRQRLPAADPALAAVAALDAVFEDALREREHHLLAQALGLLEQRFLAGRQAERMAQAAQAGPVAPVETARRDGDGPAATPGRSGAAIEAAASASAVSTAATATDTACAGAGAEPVSTLAEAGPLPDPSLPPPAASRSMPMRRPVGRALASRQRLTPPPAPAADLPAWRRALAADALALLQAELALRWAPVAGLLELLERGAGLGPAAPAVDLLSTTARPAAAPSPTLPRDDRPLPPPPPAR